MEALTRRSPAFLDGGGEMGALMRVHDWARSPLGEPETWPSALRTAVGLMLGARQPIYIAWGDELTSLYNDGYLSIVGSKHPHGFGTPFRDLWAEIWNEFRPIVEATMAGRAQHFVDMPIALAGRPGLPVGWFTFSYTALREDGVIRGFYCAATETTEKVLAEERQRFLLKLGDETRRLADSDAILQAASRALGEQLRVTRVTYADIDEARGWARPRVDWTDGSVAPLPPELRLEDFGAMLEPLRTGRTLRVADTLADARFETMQTVLKAIDIAAAVSVPLLKEDRFVANLIVHQRVPRAWTDAEVSLIEAVADHTWSAVERARAEQALRESEARQTFLLALSDAIRPHSEPSKIKAEASRVLGERLQANRVFYAEIEGDDWVVTKGHEHGAAAGIPDGRYSADTYGRWIMQTYRAGERIVFRDTRTDPRFSPTERAAHAAIHIIGAVGVPLVKKGELVAILTVHAAEPRDWTEVEIALVQETAERTWAAVERARAEDAMRESERRLQIIDITASKEAEAALREADQRKDEFLAMLAHELRNPLAPLRTAARVLKLSGSTEPHVKQTSEIIERQVGHMTKILDDLLDVSRVTRGLVQLSCESVEMGEVIATALEQCRSLIETRRQRLSLTLPPTPVFITGDHVRLVQIVANILSNAAKYSDPDTEIALSLEAGLDEIVFQVRDRGIGIAPALLPRVFDLFTQADRTSARSQGGLGLGLALVKRLVELHGGNVHARSEGLGRGAEFIVRLPRRIEPEPHPVNGASETRPAQTRIGDKLDIMVVDDNKDAADGLAMLLQLEGHRVHVAYNAHSALERAQLEKPSVMVLDIGLPGMDGYELAKELRTRPDTSSATLIALTGYGQEQDQLRAREAGFDHHLVKPVDPLELSSLLSGLQRS